MARNRLLRVTQIDAVHLDKEIEKILTKLLKECTSYLPPGFIAVYEPELHLLIKLLILNYSIFENGTTFGQKLLAIKYKNMSQFKRILYSIFNSLDYVKQRLEMLPFAHNSYKSLVKFEVFLRLCAFINLSIFLRYGKMPLLIERILGLEQVYSHNVQRQFGSKYMTRELLWNGFMEILLYVLPLVNYHKIRRIISSVNPFHKKLVFSPSKTRALTIKTTCAYCSKSPVLPHHMGCSHIFCYVCLKGNQVADSRYQCPICEYSNESVICERIVLYA